MNHLIAPSILAADFGRIYEEVEMINRSEADWIHVDVMDGVFVPNISFGFPVLKAIKKASEKPLDVHLMIAEPGDYIEQFADAGADIISVHYEVSTHLNRLIDQIKKAGARASVVLNPHTPVDVLEEILPELDMVLIMSVNPGFGGQKFIESSVDKIEKLVLLKKATGSAALIEVDGGVNMENAPRLLKAGADVLVAGSFVFNSDTPEMTISGLKHLDFQNKTA